MPVLGAAAELGIDIPAILRRTFGILTFRLGSQDAENLDLGGPLIFMALLGAAHLLAGKLHFGYILGWTGVASMLLWWVWVCYQEPPPPWGGPRGAAARGGQWCWIEGWGECLASCLASPPSHAARCLPAWRRHLHCRLPLPLLTSNPMPPLPRPPPHIGLC